MIRITNKGFRGRGLYVGRPSPFGNPFPVKRSRFSRRVYSLEDSLEKYREYFYRKFLQTAEGKKTIEKLAREYAEKGYLELDCWCINKVIKDIREIDIFATEKLRCHAEIVAYAIMLKASQFGAKILGEEDNGESSGKYKGDSRPVLRSSSGK